MSARMTKLRKKYDPLMNREIEVCQYDYVALGDPANTPEADRHKSRYYVHTRGTLIGLAEHRAGNVRGVNLVLHLGSGRLVTMSATSVVSVKTLSEVQS